MSIAAFQLVSIEKLAGSIIRVYSINDERKSSLIDFLSPHLIVVFAEDIWTKKNIDLDKNCQAFEHLSCLDEMAGNQLGCSGRKQKNPYIYGWGGQVYRMRVESWKKGERCLEKTQEKGFYHLAANNEPPQVVDFNQLPHYAGSPVQWVVAQPFPSVSGGEYYYDPHMLPLPGMGMRHPISFPCVTTAMNNNATPDYVSIIHSSPSSLTPDYVSVIHSSPCSVASLEWLHQNELSKVDIAHQQMETGLGETQYFSARTVQTEEVSNQIEPEPAPELNPEPVLASKPEPVRQHSDNSDSESLSYQVEITEKKKPKPEISITMIPVHRFQRKISLH